MPLIRRLPTLFLPVRRHSQVGLCQNLTAAVDSRVVLRVITDFGKSESINACGN